MSGKGILTFRLCFFILALFCFIGCEKQKPEQEAATKQVENTAVEKTTLDKLQGKWMSLDDPSNVIEFYGSTKTEYYDTQVMETSEFEILDKCRSGFSNADIEGEFIDDGEICHKIEEITDDTLILIYMDRGNILRYKKI